VVPATQVPKAARAIWASLHVQFLIDKNALKRPWLFDGHAQDPVEMLEAANEDLTVLNRGDVSMTANCLVGWLKGLANPVVPNELLDRMVVMVADNKFLGFLELLPQVHRMTLTYILGFLQEMVQNAEANSTNAQGLAAIFGPAIANPAGPVRDGPRIERISAVAVARLIESADPRIVWPLDPEYLADATPVKGDDGNQL
jgi:hypothetical protein